HSHADSRPLHLAIQSIVAADPTAAAGLADEWLYLALCERDPVGAGKALAAVPPDGYNNEGVAFSHAWCEAIVARMEGNFESARSAFSAARGEVEKALR